MGICVACFERDIAGALGLHRAGVVQYVRPEIIGFIMGSLIAAYSFKEFKPRCGSAPVVRFALGMFAMIGALVFLGCPWRAILRLAGGDGNAIVGILGLSFGVWIGVLFLKNGYNLGRTQPSHVGAGWILPLLMLGLLALMLILSPGGRSKQERRTVLQCKRARCHACPSINCLGHRSWYRFYGPAKPVLHHGSAAGSYFVWTDPSVVRFSGIAYISISCQCDPGTISSRICRTARCPYHACLEFCRHDTCRIGLCPGRGMSGPSTVSGRRRVTGDAAVFVLGMIVGAGFAHNFGLASSPKGVGPHGIAAVIVGLVFCLFIGFSMKKTMNK